MTTQPERWKDSEEVDATTRALLRAGSRTCSLPPTHRRRGELRVARMAAAPAVVLGLGLWTKVVAAAFGAGVATAVAVVVVSPAARSALGRMGPPAAPVGPPAASPSALLPVGDGLEGKASPAPAPGRGPVEVPPAEQNAVPSLPSSFPLAERKPSGATARVVAAASPSVLAEAAPSAQSGSVPTQAFGLVERAAPDAHGSGLSVLAAEVALLAEARRLVPSDPNSALALLNRHSLQFPGGVLATEREVLVIECLRRTARGGEAAARAEGLLQTAPDALYRGRLKRATER